MYKTAILLQTSIGGIKGARRAQGRAEGCKEGQEGRRGGQEGCRGGQEGCSTLLFLSSWNTEVRMVGCDLTSHSAIFQLCSDWTIVQFPNLDLLPDAQIHG